MKLCLVLVHYFTPDLLQSCVKSILETTRSFDGELQIVIVDNGSETSDHAMIDALPAVIIRPGENLGYAAAINRAAAAREADVYVFMNPDITVSEGCVRRLAAVAYETGGVSGPEFYLDAQRQFLLPPSEDRGFGSELLRVLAAGSRLVAGIARSRWRRHAHAHWTAGKPVASHHLSGAMIAVSAKAWARVGPFDEAYKLYYEETDWLRRAAAAGVPATYLPDARAIHFYNKSAGKEPRAEAWFRQSERRFRRKHYGNTAAAILKLLGRAMRPRPECASDIPLARLADALAAATTAPAWLEIALSPTGFPATACRIAASPVEALASIERVLSDMGPGRYSVRLVDGEGVEIWHRLVQVDAPRLQRRKTTTRPKIDLSTDDFRIRTYRPGDEVEINRLFNETFGANRTIGEWRTKFHAFGYEPRIILIVDRDDRIVTHYASFQVPFEIDGKNFVVSQVVDVFSARREAAVSRQFFVRAATAFIERFCGADGISAIYGFPGPRAYRLGQHIWKYRAFAPVTVWRTRLRRKHRPLLWARSLLHRTETGLEAHGPAIDRLWDRARRLYAAAARRDSSWLAERYFKRGAEKYRTVFRRDGAEIKAWGVFVMQGQLASVVDLVWDGADLTEVRAVLTRIRRDARELGARELQMWSPEHGPLAAALGADGWHSAGHPDGAFHVVQSFDPGVDEIAVQKGMFYSMGDSDLI
jgi:GT2 family glycosyltransferase